MITIDELLTGVSSKKKKIHSMQDIEASMFLWLEELVNQQFEWKGVPEEIPFYTIEKALFFYGNCAFFKVGENYFALPTTLGGEPNLYGQPIQVQALGFNGMTYGKMLNVADRYDTSFNLVEPKNAVLIRNNEQMISTYALIRPYMSRLMYIWQSIGIEECISRTKLLIHANKDLSGAMKKQFDTIFESSSPICIVNDSKYTDDKLDSLDLNHEFDVTNYWDDFDNTLSLLLTICGIKSLNQKDKKERLTSGEVDSNNELVVISEDTKLAFRKDACKDIEKLFSLTISVDCKHSMEDLTLKKDPTPTENAEKVEVEE